MRRRGHRAALPTSRLRFARLLAATSIAGLALVDCGSSSLPTHHAAAVEPTVIPSSPASTTTPSATHRPAPRPLVIKHPQAWLHQQLVSSLGSASKHLGLAAIDLLDDRIVTFRPRAHLFTASMAKIGIATSLLRRGHPSSHERALMTEMIEHSNNDAANHLWRRIGEGYGMQRTNRALGITNTRPGPGIVWGLTSTTAADELKLLYKDFYGHGLNRWSRHLLLHLMRNVEDDQRWGVTAAARKSDTVALKNGWLPHRADHNRWIVGSAGYITGPGRRWLIVVLSNHHPTEGAGITVVRHVARLAGMALRART